MGTSKIVGIVLIAAGVLALVYGGFTYNKNRTVLQIGSVNVTASEQNHIPIPAIAGVALLVGGAVLLVVGKRRLPNA